MERRDEEIRREIDGIKRELVSLGPLHPGSLSMQKRSRGGEYPHLSYTRDGKGHTEYVRKSDLPAVRQELENYGKMRELVSRWVGLEMELSRRRRGRRTAPGSKDPKKP
ncbi:MAG: hypothetical protein R6U36_00015 [Candidatus Fermentibacteraceae bacterium]